MQAVTFLCLVATFALNFASALAAATTFPFVFLIITACELGGNSTDEVSKLLLKFNVWNSTVHNFVDICARPRDIAGGATLLIVACGITSFGQVCLLVTTTYNYTRVVVQPWLADSSKQPLHDGTGTYDYGTRVNTPPSEEIQGPSPFTNP